MFPRLDYYHHNPYFYGGYNNRYCCGYNGYGYGYNPYYPYYYNNIPPPSPLPYYIPPYAPITPLQLAYQQNYSY
jgi:hypothetical protein